MNEPSVPQATSGPLLVRHEGHTPRERSACGWRDRLISREDESLAPAAWAHAVDIDGAKLHFHKRSTELYYVLEGSGSVLLDGVEQSVPRVRWSTFRRAWCTEPVAGCGFWWSAFRISPKTTTSRRRRSNCPEGLHFDPRTTVLSGEFRKNVAFRGK